MASISMTNLLEAGVHFGHLTRKWNPKMKRYIYTARDNVHVIDLALTVEKLKEATHAVTEMTKQGKDVLFVGTKRQASVVISTLGQEHNIPFIAQRWLGGLLTNFESVSSTWKRLQELDAQVADEATFKKLSTRDQFAVKKEREKLEKLVGGLRNLNDLPGMLFVIDIKREKTAVEEANKVGIPVVALVDTNANPGDVKYPIPGNDDGIKSIEVITQHIVDAVQAGRGGTKAKKEQVADSDEKVATKKTKPAKSDKK